MQGLQPGGDALTPALALAEGWTLGLSTGAYCAVSCLPVLAPYIMGAGEKSLPRGLLIFSIFLGGRLAAYLGFAAAAMLLGRLAAPALPDWAGGAAMLAAGLILLSAPFLNLSSPQGKDKRACPAALPAAGKSLPFSLGFLSGLNFCPPVLAGLMRLSSLPDFFSGMIYFGGFFAATALFLLPALLPVPFLTERVKVIGKMALILSGLWLTGNGLASLV
ncbi:MAG: sulfite exporter TauE/SafE family protein [Elusimicrobiales bacterium]|nr:sulfite exporter TauE/SafE family protein [Elusimicrobiales bacterium]